MGGGGLGVKTLSANDAALTKSVFSFFSPYSLVYVLHLKIEKSKFSKEFCKCSFIFVQQ